MLLPFDLSQVWQPYVLLHLIIDFEPPILLLHHFDGIIHVLQLCLLIFRLNGAVREKHLGDAIMDAGGSTSHALNGNVTV